MTGAVTGIILAGGRSTRMGQDKAFLTVAGERLVDRQVRLFRGLFAEVIIVTSTPLAFLDQPVAIARDVLPGRGALGGLYTGLLHATADRVFVAACDMPFLNPGFIAWMVSRAPGHDIVVPAPPDGLQALHALYARRCLPAIRSRLDRDRLKITGFFGGFDVLTIPPEILRGFDPEDRMFMNVNTPADLQRIVAP